MLHVKGYAAVILLGIECYAAKVEKGAREGEADEDHTDD